MKPSERIKALSDKVVRDRVSDWAGTALMFAEMATILDEQHERLEKLEGPPPVNKSKCSHVVTHSARDGVRCSNCDAYHLMIVL